MNNLYLATYNRTSEIFDTRADADTFAAQFVNDSCPFKTSIREIDFEQAFALRENGSVSYFGEKWDGNLDRGDQGEPN